MKLYIVTYFDGWYDHTWIINEGELKEYNDGSFDNGDYRFFEVKKELTKKQFKKLTENKL